MTDTATTLPCPHCHTEIVWDPANPWRPFCSERCRQADLGAWASEEFRIPGRPASPEEVALAEYRDSEPGNTQ